MIDHPTSWLIQASHAVFAAPTKSLETRPDCPRLKHDKAREAKCSVSHCHSEGWCRKWNPDFIRSGVMFTGGVLGAAVRRC